MEQGFIVHAFERSRSGRMEIALVGRLANGETFAVVERRARPFLAVREADFAAARTVIDREGDGVSVTSWPRTTMDGAPTLRIEVATPIRLRDLRESLHRSGVRTYEADVKPSTQLLVDAGIHAAVSIDGPWRPGRRVRRVYEDPAIGPAGPGFEPRLSVLSLDIETDRTGRAVWAVGLAFTGHDGEQSAEVLLNGGGAASARCFPSEKDLLLELRRRILELDPDILTGWNIVDFDFRALHRRFGDLGVPFDIGRSDSPATFLDRERGEGGVRWRRSRAIADGRQVLDALWLVRLSGMGLEDYRLETVARALLGRGKLLDRRPGESSVEAIERLYRTDPEALCVYCLGDARLVLDILASEGFLDTALRKSLLIGTTLDQTWVSVASFEYLYLEHLHRRGMVAPTLGVDQDPMERSPGGGLITPRAGLADNVLAFDFRSLYPSLIRTFNIDPLTRVVDTAAGVVAGRGNDPGADRAAGAGQDAGDAIAAPNGARFRREPGILPEILERFFVERAEARRRGDERSSYAYKIVMNSFYGVLGTEGCRFAAPELAGAITSFGQHVLFWARDLITAEGLEVLYGDTDSLFVRSGLPRDAEVSELRGMGERLCRLVNDRLAVYVRERWAVDSRLELEFETVYRRFFLPPVRTVGAGAEDGEDAEARGRAKGYAGLRLEGDGERLEIVGMEAVRHDWTELAHELQRDLLGWVFHDVPSAEIVERVRVLLHDLRAGLKDDRLTYRRSLRKPVEAYTKSSPPHVRAAALLPPEERTGLIRYVWTRDGPQPESRRSAAFDYEHYAGKQLAPIVEAVAPYIGLDLEAVFASDRQLRLF
jgi:DNA polymerase-2